MTHWRANKQSGPVNAGGVSANRPAYDAGRVDLISFERFLHRSEFTQTLLDVGAILFGFLFVTVTGMGLAASLFFLLFVKY
jgi:hypothetical protein